jgi:hypothetical protein
MTLEFSMCLRIVVLGKYQDTDTTRLGVVQININKPSTPQLVTELNRTRAAGINIIIHQV